MKFIVLIYIICCLCLAGCGDPSTSNQVKQPYGGKLHPTYNNYSAGGIPYR